MLTEVNKQDKFKTNLLKIDIRYMKERDTSPLGAILNPFRSFQKCHVVPKRIS